MARADRVAQMDEQRRELEGEYRATLIAALERCAGGKWGLFDHQGDRHQRAAVAPVIAQLDDLAVSIDQLRGRLGDDDFALHGEFLAARGPVSPSAVGEPKQARAWLDRLAADPPCS